MGQINEVGETTNIAESPNRHLLEAGRPGDGEKMGTPRRRFPLIARFAISALAPRLIVEDIATVVRTAPIRTGVGLLAAYRLRVRLCDEEDHRDRRQQEEEDHTDYGQSNAHDHVSQ
jgi:hypothetical protein